MYKQALKAYESAQSTAIQPKELERLAMARTTHQLTSARDNFALGKEGYENYAEALKFNQKLWTLIQSNIADNPTSGTASLRESLLNLSLFIDKHTVTALSNPDPNNLTPLIEINKSISGGLNRPNTRPDAKPATQAPALPSFAR